MTEIFEFGRHAPYIVAAYSVSAIVIAALIINSRNRLKKSLSADPSKHEEN